MSARTLAAAALVALVGTALAQPTNKPVAAPVPAKADPKGEKADIAKLLATRVTVNKYEGKFKDAVDTLATAYDLPLVLTKRAAEWKGLSDDNEVAVADQPVKLQRLANAKVETVLNLLCEQTHMKFLVYPDCIKIVPDVFGWYESGILSTPDPATSDELPFLPSTDLVRAKPLIKRGLVNASFKNKPLSEVIDEIVEATGANVAVSPLLPANVRQAAITVKFANTPVDAAVRTLCEMTETGVIEDANVLLVTTRERATARAKEELQKVKDRQPPPVVIPGGLGGFLPQPQPDLTTEVNKLKEQNDQLKKELEEIKKLLKK